MSAEQKRAITAVVISGLILFGWQYFFAPPIVENSDANPKISKTIDNNQSNNSSNNLPNGQTSSINNSDSNVANVNSPKTEIFVLKNEFVSYTISSDLVVIDVTTSRTDKTFSKLFKLQTNNKVLFNFDGNFKRLNFSFSKNSETNYSITNSNNDLAGTILVDDKGYLALNLNSTKPFNYRFELLTEKEELEGGKYSQFMFASDDLETIKVGDDDKGDKDILWFGMDFHYHLFAIVHETKPLVFETTESGKFLLQDIKSVNSFSYKYIFVKK
jgi:YidC/Oxa1 family membrane protein insertase